MKNALAIIGGALVLAIFLGIVGVLDVELCVAPSGGSICRVVAP